MSVTGKKWWKFKFLFDDFLLKFLSILMCKWWLQKEINSFEKKKKILAINVTTLQTPNN